MPQTRVSPAGMVARGALFTYLSPRLAKDAKVNITALVKGVTSRNYARSIPAMDRAIRKAVNGKLARDADISDLAELLNALKPGMEEADQMPMAAPPPAPAGGGGGAAPMGGGGDGESEDIVSQIKMYLQQEGISPEILNNLDAFLAEAGGKGGNTPPPASASPNGNGAPPNGNGDAAQDEEGENLMPEGGPGLEPRGSEETNLEAEDEENCAPGEDEVIPSQQAEQGTDEDDDDDDDADDEVIPSQQEEQGLNNDSATANDRQPITRKAMDRAIKLGVDAAVRNQKAIRNAERFVRPWVGEIAMDTANHPADVYRAALKAMGVKGADKLHPDALKPVLQAQPLPTIRTRQVSVAQDATPSGSFLDRFPQAKGITIQ